jgi:hypothetical protein
MNDKTSLLRRRPLSHKWQTALAAGVASVLLGVAALPTQATETSGSALFDGTSHYLSAGPSADWNIGSSPFTVEWFHNQTASTAFPRIFSIGSYADTGRAALAFSIEGGTGYVWISGSYVMAKSMTCGLGAWTHVAITGSGTSVSLYLNGVHQETVPVSYNIASASKPLYIGREENPGGSDTHFKGNLTNFHFVNGTALYSGTSGFTPTTSPIQPVTDTKLLLKFSSAETLLTDSSASPKTVTASGSGGGPSWSATVPWGQSLSTCGTDGGGGDDGGGNFPGQGNGDKKGVGSGPGQGINNGGKKK